MVGVVSALLVLATVVHYFPGIDILLLTLFSILAIIVPVTALDLMILKPYQTLPIHRQKPDKERVNLKNTGFYATLMILLAGYFVFPEYHKPAYMIYYQFLFLLGLPVFILGFIYITLCERWLPLEKDGFWQMGCLVQGRFRDVNMVILAEHWRGWIIKAYFLPLMFTGAYSEYRGLQMGRMSIYKGLLDESDNSSKYNFFLPGFTFSRFELIDYLILAISLVYLIDILFAICGYIMTSKWLGSEIKSADPSIGGWMICLACYAPFWSLTAASYANYAGPYNWQILLHDHPAWMLGCGMVAFFGECLYVFSIVAMGIKFSNLTYRGITTSGFYRYTKHPMYLGKCLTWFFIYLPFASGGLLSCFYTTTGYFLTCLIYYGRARTEENHLSNYPEYVQYACWINEYGALRLLGKYIPYLSYSEKRAKASGSMVWWKKTSLKTT